MVNTVASSDAPPIVNAVKAAGGYVVIWWNKPDNLEPWSVGNNFVAFQKHSGVESGQCNGKSIGEALGPAGRRRDHAARRAGQHHQPDPRGRASRTR